MRRAWLALWLLWLGAFQAAGVHTLSVSHLDISLPASGNRFGVELDLSLRDLALTFALDANHDEQVTWGELTAIRGQIERSIVSKVTLSTAGGRCTLQPTGLATRRYDEGAYATFLLHARCPSREGLRVTYALFEQDHQHRALVTLRDGSLVSTAIASLRGGAVAIGVDASHPFVDFLREGVHHILIGYDHLAFLVCLLLPATLVRERGSWLPASSLRMSLGHVLAIVTAFTLAHSITLSLAALGWVRPASRWVEAAIAASVMLAAMNNLWPLVTRRVWVVGFGFGLVHGFGFAGALGELGIPKGARLQALVGFNLGVEAGQLAVVAALLPLIHPLRRTSWYARYAMPAASLAIAGLAAWWLYQRLFPTA